MKPDTLLLLAIMKRKIRRFIHKYIQNPILYEFPEVLLFRFGTRRRKAVNAFLRWVESWPV